MKQTKPVWEFEDSKKVKYSVYGFKGGGVQVVWTLPDGKKGGYGYSTDCFAELLVPADARGNEVLPFSLKQTKEMIQVEVWDSEKNCNRWVACEMQEWSAVLEYGWKFCGLDNEGCAIMIRNGYINKFRQVTR